MESRTISETYNMDCINYMKSIQDNFFDLAIVDPPYGLSPKSTRGCGKLKNISLHRYDMSKWDKRPTKRYFKELFRISKNQIIWGGNYFPLPPTRCFVCWNKLQPWENFSQCELAWTSFDHPAKLISLSNSGVKAEKNKIHPTQKPVELYAYLLKTFAKPGDKIFDSHLGSGSSRIAAYKMGFDFYATEIDKVFFEAQQKRFEWECLNKIHTDHGTLTQQSLF